MHTVTRTARAATPAVQDVRADPPSVPVLAAAVPRTPIIHAVSPQQTSPQLGPAVGGMSLPDRTAPASASEMAPLTASEPPARCPRQSGWLVVG